MYLIIMVLYTYYRNPKITQHHGDLTLEVEGVVVEDFQGPFILPDLALGANQKMCPLMLHLNKLWVVNGFSKLLKVQHQNLKMILC